MNVIYLKQVIEKAIKEKRWIRIDFVSKKMKITKNRVVEPFEVKSKGHHPISVIGQCYLRNDLREFQLEGIQEIEVISPVDYKNK